MRHDNGTAITLGAMALLAAGAALSGRRGARNDDQREDENPHQAVERALRQRGLHNIGLNADWSVSAWEIGTHEGHPAYLLDMEWGDDAYAVVVRFSDHHDVAELIQKFPGWREGDPVPPQAYTDTNGRVAPAKYHEDSDGYNDIISTIWESAPLQSTVQAQAMVDEVLKRFG